MMRDDYAQRRLEGKNGQREYYGRMRERARKALTLAHRTFLTASVGAILATAFELALASLGGREGAGSALLRSVAVALPVVAVVALSLAASHDLEGRLHTYGDMLSFVERQICLLRDARPRRESECLLLETESRLLGETANWFSRRSFTGVV
jgi:hypothetical protein